MTRDRRKGEPSRTDEQRQARLAEELRANLRKRKAQARARAVADTLEADASDPAPSPADTSGSDGA